MKAIHRGFPRDLWSEWLTQATELAVMQVWLPEHYYPLAELEQLGPRGPSVRVIVSHPDAEFAKLRSRDQCVEDVDVQRQIAKSLIRLEQSRGEGVRLQVRVVHSEGLIPFQLYALPGHKALQASLYPHCRASDSPQLELEGELLDNACRAFEIRWETSATFIDDLGTVHKGLLERARALLEPAESRLSLAGSGLASRAKDPDGVSAGARREELSVFISYAHRDTNYLNRIRKHLSGLRRDGLISTWHDGEILPGGDWKKEILSHLDSADVILLLVSADFIASDFCYTEEMQRAIARHNQSEALVVPIIVKAVDWEQSPLAALQVLPERGKPVQVWRPVEQGLLNVAKGLRRAIESFGRRSRPAR